MTAIDLISPELTVNGSPLRADQVGALVALRVELGLCVLGRATLRFNDPGYALAAGGTFQLGAAVEIKIGTADPVLDGQVTGVSLEQKPGDHPELVVTVDDKGHRLLRGAKPQTYLQMTYSDVIRKIVSAAGMTVDVPAKVGTSEVSEYLLQTGSALSYIDQIAKRMGMVWWVDGSKLVLRKAGDSSGTATTTLGEDLVEFSVRASGLRPTAVNVTGWDPAQQAPIVGANSTAAAADGSQFVTSYLGEAPDSKLSGGSWEVNTAEQRPSSLAEAQAIADAVLDQGSAGAVIARGTCVVNAALKPAVTLTVADAGPASGSYHVSEVTHTYTRRGFYTKFVAGPRRPVDLVDTLGREPSDPGLSMTGLRVGVVSNNNDPESLGRVKVKYTSLAGEIESTWARVVTLGAGASRGAVFQPEVNDEVLLGFEASDTRRPIVIGGLYSKSIGLPEASKIVADGKVGYRRITSRRNHVLEFADGEGETDQHVLLQLGTAAHKLRLGADAFSVEVAAGKPITIKAGSASFEISASGDVAIKGKNISIKADANVDIEGAQVTAKANAKASVQGAMVEVKGSATTDVEASGPLTLKGAMVKIN